MYRHRARGVEGSTAKNMGGDRRGALLWSCCCVLVSWGPRGSCVSLRSPPRTSPPPVPPLPTAARLGGKKKSWFNFGRPAAQAPRDALGTGVEEGGRGGSSTAAAERAPLFSGSRSDEPGRQGGGLLASLVKNK